MDEDLLDLRPAPQRLEAREGLRKLHLALDDLLEPRAGAAEARPAAVPASAALAEPTSRLRRRLAVRGWVSPSLLAQDLTPDERDAALRAVGHEVELSERVRPGEWFITLASRKRVFGSTDLALLRVASDELHRGDDDDPVRLALRLAVDPDVIANTVPEALLSRLEGQPPRVLRELSRMAAWGAAIPGLEELAAAAGARLSRRRRDDELRALDTSQVFGRRAELDRIDAFLRHPPVPDQVPTLYVNGIGGSGKSTLLMVAEKERRNAGRDLVVRLDFDNAYLDPLSHEQMDILFLRALAVEEPGLAPALQPTIEQLQSLAEHRVRARIDAEGDAYSSSAPNALRRSVRMKRAKYATKSGSDAERAGLSERSERRSALYAVGSLSAFRQRSVALFLDTIENVSRRGMDAIDSMLDWLGSVPMCVPGRDLRVVLAGRDVLGAPDMRALSARFQDHGLLLADSLTIGDLDKVSAREMLQQCGMPDPAATLGAEALPRNPLVLRLAADTWRIAKEDVQAIQDAYRDGRVDRQTASGYLAQRVVQHVPREPARRYAIAAMALEKVTEKHLRDIVIPAVDQVKVGDRKLAHKVYEGLRRATWLTIEEKPGTLRWHTELRNLALPMIQADPAHSPVNAMVHLAAAVWHGKQRSAEARSLGEQHRSQALGTSLDALLGLRVAHELRFDVPGAEPVAESHQADDEIHRLQLEGIGASAGEGDRLVAQSRGALALQMYRERPTREPGIPPTFVIRAMAITGDWTGQDVEAGKVLQQLRRHFDIRGGNMQRPMIERLYWLTRLEMLRGAELVRAHVDLLRDVCRTLKFQPRDGALFGLVAIAEGLASVDGVLPLIAPALWPRAGADVGPELRFSVVRTAWARLPPEGDRGLWITTTLGAMLNFNERWPAELAGLSSRECLEIPGGGGAIRQLHLQMERLRPAALVDVERFVSSCRDVRVGVDLSRVPPRDVAWLLRGTLVEFHAPLAALLAAGPGQPSLGRLMDFVHGLPLDRGVLTLAEFESPERRDIHARDPLSAFTAVVVALDRARALGRFCRELEREPDRLFESCDSSAVDRVVELCGRYLAWDRAIEPVPASQRP